MASHQRLASWPATWSQEHSSTEEVELASGYLTQSFGQMVLFSVSQYNLILMTHEFANRDLCVTIGLHIRK